MNIDKEGFMKKSLFVLMFLLLSTLTVFGSQLSKIAVVDVGRILKSYYRESSGIREYDSIKEEMTKGLTQIQEEIDDLNLQISEAEAQEDSKKVEGLQNRLKKQLDYKQEFFRSMSSKLASKESNLDLNSRFYSVLYKAIQYVAESEGYSLVLKTSDTNLVWYHTEVDITDKVIARIKSLD